MPAWIKQNGRSETAAYEAAPSDNKPRPWREPTVVNALRAECANKCMYCEGYVDTVSYIAVEHIKPKDSFPNLVIDWQNLGLACVRCNTNKSNYWTTNPDLQLINPYADRVADHIEFAGPLAVVANASGRGENTLRKLKFSERSDLLFARAKRIEELDVQLRRWAAEADPEKKELFAEDVEASIDCAREHAGCLRSYASMRGFLVP